MVAAKLSNLNHGRPKKTNVEITTLSQTEAAKMLNVSRDAVIQAMAVQNHGTPELIAAVQSGEVAVSTIGRFFVLRLASPQVGKFSHLFRTPSAW